MRSSRQSVTKKPKTPLVRDTSSEDKKPTIKHRSKIISQDSEQQPQGSISTKLSKKTMVNTDLAYHIKTLEIISEFRAKHLAPVDTLGAQAFFDPELPESTLKYQILMSILLSVQTKDEITHATTFKLKQLGILTPEIIRDIPAQKIEEHIRQVNFHKKKAKNMIEIAKIFIEKGPPKTYEELLSYPGVGVKIATIYFKIAEKQNIGIGVDTHVHRICNRLGFIKTDSPDKTEAQLQKLFPQDKWHELNQLLVGFGQIQCTAKNPKCSDCPVNKRCPSSLV